MEPRDASEMDGQTDRSKWAEAHESIRQGPSSNPWLDLPEICVYSCPFVGTHIFAIGTRRNASRSAALRLLNLAAFRKFWQRLVKRDPWQLIFEPDRFLRRKRRGIIQ